MSIARSIGAGIAWSTVGTVAVKAIGLINIFLILSNLTVYEYGLTELTMSVFSTIGLFMLPGLAATITADLGVERGRGNRGRMKAIFIEFFTLNVILGIGAWAILFFGSSIVASMTGNVLIDKFFKIVAFSFLIAPLRMVTQMLATATIRYADVALFTVVEEIIKGALLAYFFLVLDRGADGLLYAIVLSTLIAVIVYLPRTISAYRQFSNAEIDAQQPVWNILREHRKWSVISTFVHTMGGNLRVWLIKLLLGTEAVGIFAFAQGLFSNVLGLLPLGGVLTSLAPKYIAQKNELVRLLQGSMKLQLVFAGVCLVIALVLVGPFVRTFFPHYESAIPLLYILLFTIIPASVTGLFVPVFTALKEQRSQLSSTLLKLLCTMIVLPIAVTAFGLYGVAIEFVLTSVVGLTERFFRMRKLLPEFNFDLGHLFYLDPVERRIVDTILARIKWRSVQGDA